MIEKELELPSLEKTLVTNDSELYGTQILEEVLDTPPNERDEKITALCADNLQIEKEVRALIAANKANIPLTFQKAAAIDLAGRDVLDAVQTSVNPKVIDCPDPKKSRGRGMSF